jgi:hypothetical protein
MVSRVQYYSAELTVVAAVEVLWKVDVSGI